jgi:pyruvate dehydrogenase E1 component beta subunit
MSPSVTLSQAYELGLAEEMTRDPNVFVMGTDLFDRGGHWGQVRGLGPAFGPARVRDTPISEAAMVAAGVGAALAGMRPVVDLNFIDFIFGAMDEVVNQAAKARFMWDADVPLVIRGTAGVALGGAHHNNSIEAWFAHTPGLSVIMPATPRDTKGLIKSAVRSSDPVLFLMHKMLTGTRGPIGDEHEVVPIGSAAVVRPGDAVTVVAYSVTVGKALKAAEELAADGIEVEIVDLRTVYPVDFETILESVKKTSRLVVVGEAPLFGSVVSEIAATVQEKMFDSLDAPVRRIAGHHSAIPHSPPLIESLIPQTSDIVRAIRELV